MGWELHGASCMCHAHVPRPRKSTSDILPHDSRLWASHLLISIRLDVLTCTVGSSAEGLTSKRSPDQLAFDFPDTGRTADFAELGS